MLPKPIYCLAMHMKEEVRKMKECEDGEKRACFVSCRIIYNSTVAGQFHQIVVLIILLFHFVIFFLVQSESASIRDEELQGLRQQHALLKKMLEQQQQVYI